MASWKKKMVGGTHQWELTGRSTHAVVFSSRGEEDAPADWEVQDSNGTVFKKGRGTVKASRAAAEAAFKSNEERERGDSRLSNPFLRLDSGLWYERKD